MSPTLMAAIDASTSFDRILRRYSNSSPSELTRKADATELRLIAAAAIDLAKALNA